MDTLLGRPLERGWTLCSDGPAAGARLGPPSAPPEAPGTGTHHLSPSQLTPVSWDKWPWAILIKAQGHHTLSSRRAVKGPPGNTLPCGCGCREGGGPPGEGMAPTEAAGPWLKEFDTEQPGIP